MYRVVTDVRDHRGNRILESGPWLASQREAESWAAYLRAAGYSVRIEQLDGQVARSHMH